MENEVPTHLHLYSLSITDVANCRYRRMFPIWKFSGSAAFSLHPHPTPPPTGQVITSATFNIYRLHNEDVRDCILNR